MINEMNSSESSVLELARDGVEDIVTIRQNIHAHPELGFEENRTHALIAEKLTEFGIAEVETLAGTGLVATIHGNRPSNRVIGFRADMDALSLQETNSFPHVSTVSGKMHACGHDGHSSMLLGAARKLAANPDFAGKVHLIFQPAEEGRGGAQKMIEDGLFSRFPCDRVFGMHSWPGLPVGSFATRSGPMMAASGRWIVTFTGPGGHGGADPHRTPDLTVVAAGLTLGLQTVVSRNVAATDQAIISIGHIHAGDPNALNVMPAELVIGGTMRAFTPETQRLLERRIQEMAELHARSHGAEVLTKIWWNAMPTINDAAATQTAVAAATKIVGDDRVDPHMPQTTGGEDFSFMLREQDGNFITIGNGTGTGEGGGGLHTPTYDFNDQALPFGIAYWLSLVNCELDGKYGTQ